MKHSLPNAALGPTDKAVVGRRGRSILGRKITPPAPGLQNMQYAADHAMIIDPLLAAHIGWQKRLYHVPLLLR